MKGLNSMAEAEGLIMRVFWPYWLAIMGMFVFAIALYYLFPEGYATKTDLGFLFACLRPGY